MKAINDLPTPLKVALVVIVSLMTLGAVNSLRESATNSADQQEVDEGVQEVNDALENYNRTVERQDAARKAREAQQQGQ